MSNGSAYSLVQYYVSLLIMQYLNLPKAEGTIAMSVSPAILPQTSIETLGFSDSPVSGSFVLSYEGNSTPAIQWNDTAATIQGYLQAITGLGAVVVMGSIASGTLTVTFNGVNPPAALLVVSSNTLGVAIVVNTADITLPFAIQNAYNLTGPNLAVGVQLDIFGKYVGVIRTGYGFQGQPITLDDADFISLIKMAILKNNAGSSLATIQQLVFQSFPNEFLVFDEADMAMSFFINSSLGSQNLVQLFVTEGLLPKPMGVQISSIIYSPFINQFFGFRTYEFPGANNSPFNTYEAYDTNWPWLVYEDAVI